MKTYKPVASACALAVGLVIAIFGGRAEGAGPWRATIVDADTGKSLDGVVVVAAFIKYTKSLAGTAGGEYYGSDEVVTSPDGRFEIPARNLWNPIRIFTEVRVEFSLVKPGYGRAEPRSAEMQAVLHSEGWSALLEKEDVVLAMPPLRTRAELQNYHFSSARVFTTLVPLDRIPRWVEARDEERRLLGLPTR